MEDERRRAGKDRVVERTHVEEIVDQRRFADGLRVGTDDQESQDGQDGIERLHGRGRSD